MTDTFRVTDERDLEIATSLGRYEGGRSGKVTKTVRNMAKISARNSKYTDEVYVWREDAREGGGIDLVFCESVKA